jgi:predicted nucleotidyltransferase component of viral defense system
VTDPPLLTNSEILDAVAERFDLTDEQARMLAAKTALVKLVTHIEHADQFVLKGGTLLHHAYGSPRVSVADVDYADGRPDKVANVESVKAALGGDHAELGFRLDVERGIWDDADGLVRGDEIPFVIPHLADGEDEIINISVAVRQGEVLDGIDVVNFRPVGLLDERMFETRAVTLPEAAAEKIVAWCIKGKPKHFHDLAFIAREEPTIDARHVADMVAEKFKVEREAPETRDEYAQRKLVRPHDLYRYWTPESRMNSLRKKWPNELGGAIILDLGELARQDESLADFNVVLDLVTSCFDATFDRL